MVALIQRPAPTFRAEAVVEGIFLDVSLAEYLGQWYVDDSLLDPCIAVHFFLDP